MPRSEADAMAVRAATIAFCLAALAANGRALAQDDPSCAQYQEPMAYNACLARHGPKASDIRTHSGAAQPHQGEARAPSDIFGRWPRAQRVHGRVHMEFNLH